MSDALDYLIKIRPDAMQSYFNFIKESGSSLDPKTRAIISVITKVDNQTEPGFRQYLVRALQIGVTPDEIIDGLFAAFPTLGLAKIVWAADIILAMDIPEFREESIGQETSWHDITDIDKIKDGEVTYLECDGRDLYIYRKDNKFRIYDSHCPHQVTNIPMSGLKNFELTCPKHGWKFDIKTGACIEKGNRPLTQLENRTENNRLFACW